MSKNTPTLKAAPRERHGSRYAKRLRTAGKLPAVLYGHGSAPMSITLDEKETVTSLKAGAHVVKLAIEGGATETCLVKDLQFGWMGDNVIHVDLGAITKDVYTVAEFKLPEGLKAVTDPHAALSRVVTIAEEAEGEAAAPTAGAEPEVLTAKKDKEGEAGAAPAAGAKAAAPAKEAKKG